MLPVPRCLRCAAIEDRDRDDWRRAPDAGRMVPTIIAILVISKSIYRWLLSPKIKGNISCGNNLSMQIMQPLI
jgi:hypothetical protein